MKIVFPAFKRNLVVNTQCYSFVSKLKAQYEKDVKINKNLPTRNEKNTKKIEERRVFINKAVFNIIFVASQFLLLGKESVFGENLSDHNLSYSTKSGLKIIEFHKGSEQKPEWGNFLIINYVMYRNISGKLEKLNDTYNNKVPFLFIHGGGQVIKGLEEAVHSMGKGGKRRVIISAENGYSGPGLGPIPAENSNRKKIYADSPLESKENFLIFDIELLDIKKNVYNQKLFSNSYFY